MLRRALTVLAVCLLPWAAFAQSIGASGNAGANFAGKSVGFNANADGSIRDSCPTATSGGNLCVGVCLLAPE